LLALGHQDYPEDAGCRVAGPGRALRVPDTKIVCHLIASNFAGGPEKQILEHCVRLPAFGWRAVVGSFRENRPHVEVLAQARARGLPTFWIDTRSSFSLRAVAQLHRQLVRFGVHVLVTHGYKSNLIGFLACMRSGVIPIPFVRGYTWENRRVRLYEACDRRLLRRFPQVLCVAEGTSRRLQGWGLEAQRVIVVHNAVDCESAAAVTAANLPAEFQLPPEVPVVVAAGRLSPEKGHRYLVEAIRLLHGRCDVSALLFGAGPEESALRRQIDAAGLGDRILLPGYRPGVLRDLAGADLVVNPSLTEGLPNVILEAFAVRTPVAATDVGGVRELVLPNETGWLVPAGDSAALATVIEAALADPGQRTRLAANAYEHVKRSFSFSLQAEKLVAVYERACAQPGLGAVPVAVAVP
jgi:glycosyltransferase involved in cell wall biosynthesis